MSVRVPEFGKGTSKRGGGHWLLYVALAVAGALLTFVGARAQQKLTDEAKFYAQNDGLVFYDVAPFAYHSWKEYHAGVQKEFLDGADAVKLTAGKDLRVTRRGLIAWTTVTIHLYEKAKDGKTTDADMRYTGIWERRGAKWLLVHEHLSVPMA
jgi:ketosteroid isomerase-like protein